jgi:hypothetical protein
MLITTASCTIERRLLVNYRLDPEAVAPLLPARFRPQLVAGCAVGGVCFIRLGDLRPAGVPAAFGMTTENVAHRFAVEWETDEGTQVGVFVPRRDTNSRTEVLAGGRVFPGQHRLARFEVHEEGPALTITVASKDSTLGLSVAARETETLRSGLFGSVNEAIEFFRRGSLGYSPAGPGRFDGVRLDCKTWEALPATVEHMSSTVFDDTTVFPAGTCALDSALVMRDLPVEWVTCGSITSSSQRGIRATVLG